MLYKLTVKEDVEDKETKVVTRVTKTVMENLPWDEVKLLRKKMKGSEITPMRVNAS
jgi:hypothetical protein